MNRRFILYLFCCFMLITALSAVSVWASGDHEGGHGTETGTVTKEEGEATDDSGHGKESTDHHQKSKSAQANYEQKETSKQDEHTEQGQETDQVGFLGKLLPGLTGAPNIHPMLVHFPIVFLSSALLFVSLSWFWNPDQFLQTARWMYWLGLISLPITAGTGFLAIGGWGGGHATTHRNLMLLTTALAFLLFGILRWLADRQSLYRIVMTVGLIIVTTFMTLGADRGAWLVFVEGSGVKPAQHVHDH